MIPPLKTRDEIPALLDSLGLTRVGAEIGVECGVFSNAILRGCVVERLYSIDPWGGMWKWEDDRATEEDYCTAVELLSQHGGRSQILKMTSQEAVRLFVPGQLDFFYLDSSHRYEETGAEIRTWWEILRSGGLAMGHDYNYTKGDPHAVTRAVDEFVAEMGLTLAITELDWMNDDIDVHSWLIEKP